MPTRPTLRAKWGLTMFLRRWWWKLRAGHRGSVLPGPGARGGAPLLGCKMGQMTDRLVKPPALVWAEGLYSAH